MLGPYNDNRAIPVGETKKQNQVQTVESRDATTKAKATASESGRTKATATLDAGSFQGDDRVAAAFAGFLDGEFGAIDQVGDDVFAVEVGLSYGFHNSGA